MGRGSRSSNQFSEMDKRFSKNQAQHSDRSHNTDGAKPVNRVSDEKQEMKHSFKKTPGEIDRESY